MPIRRILDGQFEYYLAVFDENGNERREPDGTLMTNIVRQRVAAGGVTDVFFTSHGWKGDVPAAIEQYDAWIGVMFEMTADRAAAREVRPGFAPLVVALHWPSLPWGDETLPSAAAGRVLSGSGEPHESVESQIDSYAARIADSPRARAALRTILETAGADPRTDLPAHVREAYDILYAESGLGSGDASGCPGADQDGFDPSAMIADALATRPSADTSAGTPGVLGFFDDLRDVAFTPLRQLSFWKMKDRARHFGETGGHDLLCRLQEAAPAPRFHLMGHSFGCIVVSATVAGAKNGRPLLRPVDSLFLVQGALSIWAYASDVPYAPGTEGYFHRIVKNRLVRGPIVTTRSDWDTAVGRFYPLGAKLRKQLLLADTTYPKYAGIGSYGIQGFTGITDLAVAPIDHRYNFRPGGLYNLNASHVIRTGEGASGAHSDISHPEVAHAFWAAVLSTQPGGTLSIPQSPPAERRMRSSRGQRPAGGQRPDVYGGGASTWRSPVLPPAPPMPPPAPADREEATTKRPSDDRHRERWFNVELEDHPREAALAAGEWYTLAIDVDAVARDSALVTDPLNDRGLFPDDTAEVTLTLQLDSPDFEINEHTRLLRLPRVGRSRGKARFDVSPKHNGPSTIRLTIHKEGNFIQQMDLTLTVGSGTAAAVTVATKGRPPSAAAIVRPRDVGLSIQPAAGGGYDCIVWGAVATRARLPIQRGHLANAIATARKEILKVVAFQDAAGEYVYQTSVDIAEADRDFALRTLARAGARLFDQLFFGPAAGADSKAVGESLRAFATKPGTRLKLQILAESTPVPWGLLYLGDVAGNARLDWDLFLGMRHILERIPLQNTATPPESAIPSEPRLSVGVNMNSGIDAQMAADFVARQQSFWTEAQQARARLTVTTRSTRAQVVEALASGDTGDQILYFYCHALSAGLDDPGGPDASCLVLTDDRLTLGDLSLDAPSRVQLIGSPLVFINACESAELSPEFYDGFVPYFMAKGARGVVGTECQTPALFAAEWARRFFDRFLDGQSIGESFLELRREFLEEHGNPLGLLYAVHSDGDVRIEPALSAAPAVN